MELEKDYKNGKHEEIHYHMVKCSEMLLLSKATYEINGVMGKGVEAYYAVALDRVSDVNKITNSNHILRLLLDREYDKVKENYKKNMIRL